MGETVRTVGKVLLVWLALSVPVGLLVGRVLRARRVHQEQWAEWEQRGRQVRLDQLARPVSKECPDPLVP
jgi:hypothetical protein